MPASSAPCINKHQTSSRQTLRLKRSILAVHKGLLARSKDIKRRVDTSGSDKSKISYWNVAL